MNPNSYEAFGKDKVICKVHNIVFKQGFKCLLCSQESPKFPLENEKHEKVVSEGGAYGHAVVTAKQSKALLMYQSGMSFSAISRELRITKGSVQKLVNRGVKTARKGGLTMNRVPLTISRKERLTVRLHNDEFLVKVLCDYWSLQNFVIKNRNRNLEYRLIRSDGLMFIKLHRNNTLTFRFKESLYGENEESVLDLANKRLKDFLDGFSIKGVQLVSSSKLLSRHYGIVGSGFAHEINEKKMEIIIMEDGKVRIRLDNSHDTPEIDAEHPVKAKSDSEVTREYLKDLIDNPHYKPSELKINMDTLLAVQNAYAENIKKHLEVMENINKGIQELKDKMK